MDFPGRCLILIVSNKLVTRVIKFSSNDKTMEIIKLTNYGDDTKHQ